eukprot:m51a1_g4940 putative retinal rod rhodopsin-sensitive cgmp 3 -cyclic phosphodiesterase subunit delta (155) ;mRNA; r:302676-303274
MSLSVGVSKDPKAAAVARGFRLLSMNLTDAERGNVVWQSSDWGTDVFSKVKVAKVPKSILQCKAVSREIEFSSAEAMQALRVVQRVFLHSACIEQWDFSFGFVIPGSTNTWQSTIEAAAEMLPAEVLSGNTSIETSFYDGDMFLAKSVVVLHYV